MAAKSKKWPWASMTIVSGRIPSVERDGVIRARIPVPFLTGPDHEAGLGKIYLKLKE